MPELVRGFIPHMKELNKVMNIGPNFEASRSATDYNLFLHDLKMNRLEEIAQKRTNREHLFYEAQKYAVQKLCTLVADQPIDVGIAATITIPTVVRPRSSPFWVFSYPSLSPP